MQRIDRRNQQLSIDIVDQNSKNQRKSTRKRIQQRHGLFQRQKCNFFGVFDPAGILLIVQDKRCRPYKRCGIGSIPQNRLPQDAINEACPNLEKVRISKEQITQTI